MAKRKCSPLTCSICISHIQILQDAKTLQQIKNLVRGNLKRHVAAQGIKVVY